MSPIPVMMNGLPGDVATTITRHLLKDNRFRLIPLSLTGPDITETSWIIDDYAIGLVRPDQREPAIKDIKEKEGANLQCLIERSPRRNLLVLTLELYYLIK